MFTIKRRNLLRKDNKVGYHAEGLSFLNVVVRESSPVDVFYTEKTISSDDSKECVAYVDPIKMLFNQERISSMGTMALQQWLDSLKNFKKDPLAELRAKCSDADLLAMIKSRHIQQPCEIMAWAQKCQSDMKTFESEVSKLVAEHQAQEAQQQADKLDNNVVVQPSNTQ